MKRHVKIKICVKLLWHVKKISKCSRVMKWDETPWKIYADLQFLIKKVDNYENKVKKSFLLLF